MELKYVSKISCAERHYSVREADFSETYSHASAMVPRVNNYYHNFLSERVSEYVPPPAYVNTRSNADIQLEREREVYGRDISSPSARNFSYRELRSRFNEIRDGTRYYRSPSPPVLKTRNTSPRWTRQVLYVESDWAGGARLERRV